MSQAKSIPKEPGTYPNILPQLEARDNYRITEVSRYLGLAYSTYYDLRDGKRKPSMETMQRIERLFDISIQEVYSNWGQVNLVYSKKV